MTPKACSEHRHINNYDPRRKDFVNAGNPAPEGRTGPCEQCDPRDGVCSWHRAHPGVPEPR